MNRESVVVKRRAKIDSSGFGCKGLKKEPGARIQELGGAGCYGGARLPNSRF
jgi:hypothetical protein